MSILINLKTSKIMKISRLFLFVLMPLAFIGCSSDDDAGLDPFLLDRTNFVDTYTMNFLEWKEVETLTFTNGSTSTSSSVINGTAFQDVNYKFNADGTFVASGIYSYVETENRPDGSTETHDPIFKNLDLSGDYTLNPNSRTLILKDNDGHQTVYEITQYTPTAMTLYSETEVVVGNSTKVSSQELRFSR